MRAHTHGGVSAADHALTKMICMRAHTVSRTADGNSRSLSGRKHPRGSSTEADLLAEGKTMCIFSAYILYKHFAKRQTDRQTDISGKNWRDCENYSVMIYTETFVES